MSNLDMVMKAINYIETNLKEAITVTDVSDAAGYSLYHFIRLFHGITGHTPKEYILRRRLTEAAKELLHSKGKITDIALTYQFNNSETFNRAFKRAFGLNPSELRKCADLKQLPFLSAMTEANLRNWQWMKDLEPEIVELDTICLVGLTTLVRKNTALISELWAHFSQEAGLIPNRVIPEKWYQVAFWPDKLEMDGLFIMCAVEVADLNNINPNLVGKRLPPAKYLRFVHKGLSRDVGLTYQYIYESWLPKTDYRLTLPYNFEVYGENYLGPENPQSESEIYIPVEG